MYDKLNNKICGCLVGYALGDALGKGTEFMTKDIVKLKYPNGLRTFSGIVRDSHRSQWKQNQWTNDTEVLVRMVEDMAGKGDLDVESHARMLKGWYEEDPFDIVPTMRWVLSQPDYLDHPVETARHIWDIMPSLEASNEAFGRCMVAGMWPDENFLILVRDICRLTHYEQRCIGTAEIIGCIAHEILWNDRVMTYDEVYAMASSLDERICSYIDFAAAGRLENLNLDDPDTLWYTRKSTACALLAIWHFNSMEEALYRIVDEGGDADTNAALALGLLGLKLGAGALPEYLSGELDGRERIVRDAAALTELLLKRKSA